MEWVLMPEEKNEQIVLEMIEFFYSKSFQAFDVDKLLDRNNWKKWPYDIIWKKTI